jgi:hypothetical protein
MVATATPNLLDHGGRAQAAQYLVPARAILPSLVLPPAEWSFGINPIRAKVRLEENARGSGVFITSVVAPTGPTPEICARRRLQALARCQTNSFTSTNVEASGAQVCKCTRTDQ